MRNLSIENSIIIIAGSHRIKQNEEYSKEINFYHNSSMIGCSCTPIFFPNGNVRMVYKSSQSKWESNLKVSKFDPQIINTHIREIDINLSVIPCIDSLHIDNLGSILHDDSSKPNIIFCPSLSPTSSPFDDIGSLTSYYETLYVYANSASYGGSFFYIPTFLKDFLKGTRHHLEKLPQNIEAIIELVFDPNMLNLKKGSIINNINCYNPKIFPIIYTKNNTHIKDFLEFKDMFLSFINNNDRDNATELLDSYLVDNSNILPNIFSINLSYLRHHILPLYDGDITSIHSFMNYVDIKSIINDPPLFWSNHLYQAIDILTNCTKSCNNDDLDKIFECIKYYRNLQLTLPKPQFDNNMYYKDDKTSNIFSKPTIFLGNDNLIESFQNRGHDLNKIIALFSNKNIRVILITGSIGIGKSDFVNWAFRKQFRDWETMKINIPWGSKVSRLLAEIGYQLGFSIDIDSLSNSSHTVFRQKVRKIIGQFYNTEKRVLIIDDLHAIIKEGNAKDHKQLSIFIEEASNPEIFIGGRIILMTPR